MPWNVSDRDRTAKRALRRGMASFVLNFPDMGNTTKKILLVDGDEAFRKSVRTFINGLGHEVDEAASGPEALEKVSSAPPDLILMDVRLPGMNGDEVTKQQEESRHATHSGDHQHRLDHGVQCRSAHRARPLRRRLRGSLQAATIPDAARRDAHVSVRITRETGSNRSSSSSRSTRLPSQLRGFAFVPGARSITTDLHSVLIAIPPGRSDAS